jgi:hypothetical protein
MSYQYEKDLKNIQNGEIKWTDILTKKRYYYENSELLDCYYPYSGIFYDTNNKNHEILLVSRIHTHYPLGNKYFTFWV